MLLCAFADMNEQCSIVGSILSAALSDCSRYCTSTADLLHYIEWNNPVGAILLVVLVRVLYDAHAAYWNKGGLVLVQGISVQFETKGLQASG